MLDEVTVFHKGGLVLWQCTFGPVAGNPVNQLVKTVLLADRAGENHFMHDTYKIQWVLENQLDLVFVVVYQHLLALTYIEQLLDELRANFCRRFNADLTSRVFLTDPTVLNSRCGRSQEFTAEFKKIHSRVEARAEASRDERRKARSGSAAATRAAEASAADAPAAEAAAAAADDGVVRDAKGRVLTGKAAAIQKAKLRQAAAKSGSSVGRTSSKKAAPKKTARTWNADGTPGTGVTTSGFQDLSEQVSQEQLDSAQSVVDASVHRTDLDGWSDDEGDIAPAAAGAAAAPAQRGRFAQWMRDRLGTREVDEGDLETILPKLRETLTEKNVAQEIADQVTGSVSAELRGKKLANFTSLTATIKSSMEQALLRILTPKRNIDILRDVQKAKAAGRPYVITFCGVNGVGKSTNLSKVAYWLKGQGLSVLIAACDTFRSGAVEQLEVHSRRIGVPVFQKGYAKDAADVATSAITQGRKDGRDVVLVDTAGRMQDNQPLMAALAKLIHSNRPDLVLFVGEALVGNDGVDQLRGFNRALHDLTPVGQPQRGIDGILLTKFDTIDDKVGTAVSMVYQSGQPIVFVGVGQQYQDLRSLNPSVVVRSLLR